MVHGPHRLPPFRETTPLEGFDAKLRGSGWLSNRHACGNDVLKTYPESTVRHADPSMKSAMISRPYSPDML